MRNAIAISLICFSIIPGCTKRKDCPAFNPEHMQHFPYPVPDTLRFENASGGLLEIYIHQIKQSKAFSIDCKNLHKQCPCENFVEAYATNSRSDTSYTLLRMEQFDSSPVQIFRHQVLDYAFEFDFVDELPYIDQMPHIELIGPLVTQHATYENVLSISREDAPLSGVSKVYFNKEKGVLRFIEKPSNVVWEIVE